jgi:hypothetical protein
MKHSLDDLLAVAYRYYPRGIEADDPRYTETEEHRRLAAARREAAAARAPWRAMLQRLGEAFPGRYVHDNVASCPADAFRAGYEGLIDLPKSPDEHGHTVSFRVSFLVPYYVVYSTRTVDVAERTEALRERDRDFVRIWIDNTLWRLPRDVVAPDVLARADRERSEAPPARRRTLRFDLLPDERPYGEAITRAIEETYGFEPMPPELGTVIVPDVATGFRTLGSASVYDCLVSDVW